MTITFMGLNSVLDRTLFTNRGPIVKRPLPILTGTNLQVISETDISIPTGAFTSIYVGFRIDISGSANYRNDGDFRIKSVLSSTRLRLENASFDISDVALTTNKVVALANDLKDQFNRHRIQAGIHGTNDTINVVTAQFAVSLNSAIILLNDIRTQFAAHVVMISGTPPVHSAPDPDDLPIAEPANSLTSAVRLANDLRAHFENHRTLNAIHLVADFVNKITALKASVIKGTFPNPLTGPLTWTIKDPQVGLVADDPVDVNVFVNSNPASVDAVFGLLGAIVLTVKPGPLDDVKINYDFLNNPPARLLRLNSPEFNLNQAGNIAYSGFPSHRYRARSYLIDPHNSPDFMSPVVPKKVGWKYKAFERAYSAVLNDPTTLLLNVPTNRVTYPVLFTEVQEQTVRYDPTSLPQNASDPWTLEGVGTFSLLPGGTELTITDSGQASGTSSRSPFFTHIFNFLAPSIVSAAFRAYITTWVSDGAFTGVCFGISDGNHTGLIGFLETNATGLSSAITRANNVKEAFNAHLIQANVHIPNDPLDSEIFVDAHDLPSLIILINDLKAKFNVHINKSGLLGVHQITDVTDIIFLDDAHDLDTAVLLTNTLALNLNTHRVQISVHFINDIINVVPLVKQVGFLTNRSAPEIETSWNAFSVDWTIQRTYRMFRDPDGNVSIYLSGDPVPSASALSSELPAISDLDGRFDPLQQVFFGSIEKEATSTSKWNFIRANINPLDSNLIGDNKFVDVVGLPELSDPPWITVGQGGFERLVSGSVLLTDSTCSTPTADIPALGQSSGAYRGYLRIEPIITSNTTVAYDINMQIDYYTFGVDNKSAGIFIDDDDFTIQLSFIQFSPSPATVTGTSTEPFALTGLDVLTLSISGGPSITVALTAGANLATVIAEINTAVGFVFADNNLNHIRLTSSDLGAEANFNIISGSAMAKLGLSPGIYFGKDSNPEPRVSWFGDNLPDQDTPHWSAAGNQSARLQGRTLRIMDVDPTDYKVYTLSDNLITGNVFNSSVNWKLDVRLSVLSFAGSITVPASPPFLNLGFVGALVSVDEGPTGKSIELQLAVDISGNQYINLVSFNSFTSALDVKGQYAFAWNDGKIHSFNIYTNKSINAIFILADGTPLTPIIATPTPTYSGLNQGVSGPSISFGSGSAPVTGSDLRVPQSIVDWYSVAIFKDSKVADPTAGQRRFIGIFKGGDPTVLSSYYLTQFDWSTTTEYRLVRDPQNAVSLFVSNNPTPAISVSYDSLTLPLVSSSFLQGVTDNRSAIAFGSFNPQEIVRTRWANVQYSVGKITLTNRLIPPHQILNQANVIVSPEHLTTDKPHGHFGFRVYSGGTPTDDFLADPSVPAFTILGEGTPPVPATQNLDNRGGLQKTVTPFDDILTSDFVNTPGFTSNYIDDTVNFLTVNVPESFAASLADLISLVNDIQIQYNNHIISLVAHILSDIWNTSIVPPAFDLLSAISLVNELKFRFNGHLVEGGVHGPNDTEHTVTLPDATDLPTAIELANNIRANYEGHRLTDGYHDPYDFTNTLVAPNSGSIYRTLGSLDEQRVKFAAHATSSVFHKKSDRINGVYFESVPGIGYAVVQQDPISLQSINIQQFIYPVAVGDFIAFLTGPNESSIVAVSQVLPNGSFNVAPSPPLLQTLVVDSTARAPSAIVGFGNAQITVTTTFLINISIVLNVGDVIQFTAGPNIGQKQTVIQVISPSSVIVGNAFGSSDLIGSNFNVLNASPGDLLVDLNAAISLGNELKMLFDRHLTQDGVHYTPDTPDNISLVPDATDLASLTNLVNNMHDAMNNHFQGNFVHLRVDTDDIVTTTIVVDSLVQAILVANNIKQEFNLHLIQIQVHVENDEEDSVLIADAIDLPTLIVLLNLEKQQFNLHRTAAHVHVLDDTVNVISTPDAFDLSSALDLAIALGNAYEAHRVQPGVHGSAVFIRLDPPSRVLYEGMKFFEFESGTPDLVSPFSDDETWHLDGFNAKQDQTLSILGALPQQSQLQGNNNEPFTTIVGDTLILAVDGGGPITVTFQPGETDTTSVSNRINATPGLPSNLAAPSPNLSLKPGLCVMLTSPTIGPLSDVKVLGGTAVTKLGLDVCQTTPWFIISDDPSNISVNLISSIFGFDITNYQTIGSGTRTVIRNNSSLPDVISLDWEIILAIQINSVFSPANVDSGIYVGVSGIAGPGYSVAIGFDRMDNLRFVKVQDLNANKTLFRCPFNWADGNPHSYKLSRSAKTNAISLVILE